MSRTGAPLARGDGDRPQCTLAKFESAPKILEQGPVLLDECAARLDEDADKVVQGEVVKWSDDGKATNESGRPVSAPTVYSDRSGSALGYEAIGDQIARGQTSELVLPRIGTVFLYGQQIVIIVPLWQRGAKANRLRTA